MEQYNNSLNPPICIECLSLEIENWLCEKDENAIPKLKELNNIHTSNCLSDTKCIVCKNNMDLYTDLFAAEINNWIETDYPELLQEFKLIFVAS